jgi:hypothetical protein
MAVLSSTRGSGERQRSVLSNTIVSALASRSMTSPPLRMTPLPNNVPAATTCTAGNSKRDRAWGVMMSTAMAMTMDS